MHRQPETIRVAAIFAPGCQVRPVWFEWRRQKYQVAETSYFWKENFGGSTTLHFAVSDGCNLFELSFDPLDQKWTLEGVEQRR